MTWSAITMAGRPSSAPHHSTLIVALPHCLSCCPCHDRPLGKFSTSQLTFDRECIAVHMRARVVFANAVFRGLTFCPSGGETFLRPHPSPAPPRVSQQRCDWQTDWCYLCCISSSGASIALHQRPRCSHTGLQIPPASPLPDKGPISVTEHILCMKCSSQQAVKH